MVIRKATPEDSESIATHLFMAMNDIVYKFIGEKDRKKGMNFMKHFVRRNNNQYSWQNCWVVEKDSMVVATINIYDGAKLVELRKPVIDYIQSNFKKDFSFEDETQAGEYYIDTLGVDPSQQGKGLGTKLLQFVIDEYVGRRNQTVGLLVEDTNPNAKRLYIKLGFKTNGTRVVFGKNMEHMQIKSVEGT